MTVKFASNRAEVHLIGRIADRAMEKFPEGKKRKEKFAARSDIIMDLDAVNSNGCRMDFGRLLTADDFNFWHDIHGISSHIDRTTGKLKDLFRPRFALKVK